MSKNSVSADLGTRVSKPRRTHINRRHFLLGMATISAFTLIPSVISCSPTPIHDIHGQLTDEEFATLIAVQNHLFPRDSNSPGAEDFHAGQYFTWVLTDPNKDSEDITQMKDGIRWVNESADESYSAKFSDLNIKEKEIVLRTLADESWGESWLSVVLTNIFEALLSDPIYGSNTNESGWNWLDHTTGNPRPEKEYMYNPS